MEHEIGGSAAGSGVLAGDHTLVRDGEGQPGGVDLTGRQRRAESVHEGLFG